MTDKINGVKVFYTENGNPVAKSNSGKKKGATLGALAYVGSEAVLLNHLNKEFSKRLGTLPADAFTKLGVAKPSNLWQYMKSYFKGDYVKVFKDFLSTSKNPIMNFVAKASLTKGGRIGLFAGAAAIGLGTSVLIGRGIGAIVDKIKDKRHAKEVDAVKTTEKLKAEYKAETKES